MLIRARSRRSTPLGAYQVACRIGIACSACLWVISNFIGWHYRDGWDHAQIWANKVVGFGFGLMGTGLFAVAGDRRRQGRRSPAFGLAVVLFIANAVTLAASLNDLV